MSSVCGEQKYLLVADSDDDSVPFLFRQIGISSHYAKLNLETWDLATSTSPPNLDSYCCVVITTPIPSGRSVEIREVLELYVGDGGGLVVCYPETCNDLRGLCGIEDCHYANHSTCNQEDDTEIHFVSDFFSGLNGVRISFKDHNKPFKFVFDQNRDKNVIAMGNSIDPVAWQLPYGSGSVLAWNMDVTAEIWCRSMIIQSMLSVQTVSVRWIANAGMIQIDDFPSGQVDEPLEPVMSLYGLTSLEFYERMWWPDMLEMAEAFGVRYSFAVPFNYNLTTQAPFEFFEWDSKQKTVDNESMPFGAYFSKIVRQYGELGMHGYNHIPLELEHWNSRKDMVESLNSAMERWSHDGLGPAPTSYVPPMNRYDKEGARAITESIPEIKVICGDFWLTQTHDRRRREFEKEPWNPALFCMPRVTAGYRLTQKHRILAISLLAELGAWTHFLHPDDIFDIPTADRSPDAVRNGDICGWDDSTGGSLKEQFREWLSFISENFPWLRYLEVTPAADVIQTHLKNEVSTIFHADSIELVSDGPGFIQIRIKDDRDLVPLDEEIEVVHQHKYSNYHLWTLSVPGGSSKIAYG